MIARKKPLASRGCWERPWEQERGGSEPRSSCRGTVPLAGAGRYRDQRERAMTAQKARQGSSSTTGRVKGLLAGQISCSDVEEGCADHNAQRSKQSPEMSQLPSKPPPPAGRQQRSLACIPSAPTNFTCMANSIKLKL